MEITSSAFEHNGTIPQQYTCDGEDINPPLTFHDIPQNTKSLALIVDDPDAPNGDWVHWLIWNMSPATKIIKANSIPENTKCGTTDFRNTGYGGPCPPSGTHRYHFKLFALDTELSLDASAKKQDLLTSMANHTIARAELIGRYARQ